VLWRYTLTSLEKRSSRFLLIGLHLGHNSFYRGWVSVYVAGFCLVAARFMLVEDVWLEPSFLLLGRIFSLGIVYLFAGMSLWLKGRFSACWALSLDKEAEFWPLSFHCGSKLFAGQNIYCFTGWYLHLDKYYSWLKNSLVWQGIFGSTLSAGASTNIIGRVYYYRGTSGLL